MFIYRYSFAHEVKLGMLVPLDLVLSSGPMSNGAFWGSTTAAISRGGTSLQDLNIGRYLGLLFKELKLIVEVSEVNISQYHREYLETESWLTVTAMLKKALDSNVL